MAKQTKKRVKKVVPYELGFPNVPNPGTMDKNGRILRVREDFKSINELIATLIEYYMAYDILHKKLWPTLKTNPSYEDLILNCPEKIALLFGEAYAIGADMIEDVYKGLGRLNSVIQFPTFTSYVDFLDEVLNGGIDFWQGYYHEVFLSLEKMYYKTHNYDLSAVFEMLLMWGKQIKMRDTLLDWIRSAKKSSLYKAGSKLPVRKKLLRHRKSVPSSTVTLREFMDKYCDADGVDIESKVTTLYNADRKGIIKLPGKQNNWIRGKTKLFAVADLKENWGTYKKALPNLPNLKQ